MFPKIKNKDGKMKNKLFSLVGIVCFILCSCNVSLDEQSNKLNQNTKYGTIRVVSERNSSRALEIDSIKYADVKITGTGITPGNEPFCESEVEAGVGTFEIKKVPVGKNRIVTVTAKDSSKAVISNVIMRAVVDVEADKDSVVSVNWNTTAVGNVFAKLYKDGVDLALVDRNSIENTIYYKGTGNNKQYLSPFLIDTDAIANDYRTVLKEPINYVLEPASLKFIVNEGLGTYKIQVCDQLSKVYEGTSTSGTVENIAPGTYQVKLIDSTGKVTSKSLNFKSGQQSEISFATVTDKIILHAYDYVNVYIWETLDPSINKQHFAMEQEGSTNWYKKEFNVTSASIIFTKSSGGWSGQTSDLSINAGEWWYKDGKWFDEDPTDLVPPTIESVTPQSGNVTGVVNFVVSANDNKTLKTAEVTINGEKYKSFNFTEKSSKVEFKWNSALYKNGSYKFGIVVIDSSGNRSEKTEVTLTTTNDNLPPVAKITGAGKVGKGSEKTYKASSSYDPNGTITSYKWEVSGGATIKSGALEKEAVITFPNTSTTCTITLTVVDDNGATASDVKEVEVSDESSTIDFREEQIYFVITTRFYDGDLSNNVHCWDENPATAADDPSWRGDFKGLIEKLDYIKALGFTAVWITPIVENCSGLDYHGYHAMNFSKVDKRYESVDVDFQDLINEAHARDMKIVLDVVFNHTGNFGEDYLAPMFVKDYINGDHEDIKSILQPHPNTLIKDYDAYLKAPGAVQYQTRLANMKNTDGVNHDIHNYYHHYGHGNWDTFSSQWMQIAGDCVDLNTENPYVLEYIVKAYSQYIEMGVDAFRIDTGKHIPRLVFNKHLNDAFMDAAANAGNDGFYMFTEVCARANEVVYRGTPNMSAFFYTWKESKDYPWDPSTTSWDNYIMFETDMLQADLESGAKMFAHTNGNSAQQQGLDYAQGASIAEFNSNNHLLDGNNYHPVDYSKNSRLNVIDFPMHWNFNSAKSAYGVHHEDYLYNDATWNVVYVDSHDYSPSDDCFNRYNKGTDAWAENISLMFTFRGIPCLYYGSEIEFQAGAIIDKGPIITLAESGRAYFGDHIEGNVSTTGVGEWSNATGAMKETLESPLAKHLSRMGQIRQSIPALQKGQYSTDNCSGTMSFKRRYTEGATDSFVLVTISGDSTFTNLPAGKYIDVVTGDEQTIAEGGSITATCSGQGNARIYVLQNDTAKAFGADGQIGSTGPYLK